MTFKHVFCLINPPVVNRLYLQEHPLVSWTSCASHTELTPRRTKHRLFGVSQDRLTYRREYPCRCSGRSERMHLIVFTAPTLLPLESDLITSVLDRGLQTLHLRKPGLPARAVEGLLAPLSAAARAKLVLHDHHELAARWGLKVSCMSISGQKSHPRRHCAYMHCNHQVMLISKHIL